MTAPRVSVAIATYNYGEYIADALESVRNQTFTDWEAVIVDDGSTDDTHRIVTPFLNDRRIRYLRTDHEGVSAAKSAAVHQARGELVAFLDADDIWLPEKLRKQVALFDVSPAPSVVYCRRHVINAHRIRVPQLTEPLHRGRVLAAMFLNNFVCFSSAVVHRSVFETIGYFDKQLPLAVDWDFWLRAAVHFTFSYVDDALVEYRTGHNQLSTRAEERLQIVFQIMNQFLAENSGGRELPAALIRRAYADTYCSLAYAQRNRSVWAALRSYCKAIARRPANYTAWRGIVSLAVPPSVRNVRARNEASRLSMDG